MRVTVRLFARLRDLVGAGELAREVPAGATVRVIGMDGLLLTVAAVKMPTITADTTQQSR